MRSRRRTSARRGRNDNSFWLSFSDLMSSLVLIVILVMFYMIYQYFNLAEINQAELARRQYELDQVQTELNTQQTKLTEAEEQMIAQQILLNAKQNELDSVQSVLDSQKDQLSQKESEIAAQQEQLALLSAQLSSQQNQLTAQQALLENQQVQIEQIVGLRTRIISSLSNALRTNNISATVDLTNGSIALESDVLFGTGEYELTPAGKAFVDEFLPIYLQVLFSDEYKGYVTEVIIEGHTDSTGGYINNLQLSQRRALAVASYVLADDYRHISGNVKENLRDVVTVNGRSYSDPILDEFGREDKDASRRVVFKFRLTDEQMIAQLQQILEAPQSAAVPAVPVNPN